jgi:hypothetical protein
MGVQYKNQRKKISWDNVDYVHMASEKVALAGSREQCNKRPGLKTTKNFLISWQNY